MRTITVLLLVLSTRAFGYYGDADKYSTPFQRQEWEAELASESLVPPWFVWHSAGHLAGWSGRVVLPTVEHLPDWLSSHREMLGFPSHATYVDSATISHRHRFDQLSV